MSKEYHRQHPTISFRCHSIEEYYRIKVMVKISGKSESDFIREIILDAEAKESESYKNGYQEGCNTIVMLCSICRESLIIDLKTDPEAKKKVLEIFKGYAHTECVEAQKKQQNFQNK